MSSKANNTKDKLVKKKKGATEWEPEAVLDLAATLEELINEPPFKEVSEEGQSSITAATRIPLWLMRRITRLKELSGSPYDVNSDVMRDALFIGLRVLHIRYGITPDWTVETKLAAAVDAVSAGRRVRQQLDELVDGLDEMYRDGDIEKAARNLTEYVLAAEELDNDWHRRKVFGLLAESRIVREVMEHCPKSIQKTIKGKGQKMVEGGKNE